MSLLAFGPSAWAGFAWRRRIQSVLQRLVDSPRYRLEITVAMQELYFTDYLPGNGSTIG